ncbi:MAG: hypothetical protein CBC71_06345 [Rhodobacteraceae bacterium TMED111]|nr:hypothetical protein [Marinovum sp.]MAI17155.1 hypothetical protein [Marinovum sp.]OUV41064.1 MAG: hypothetical protein CBC71_06065 [Rhodobacteraceae bacterium TMED111]OUV41118.1 MAG: hypothetical protein CBC71_06345 [Rhodobacteraceae bacterium TMED111]|tara:strand:+ start:2668 stop:3876 length:1209 start_codon:yes stop_codon:yes gene_type:complete
MANVINTIKDPGGVFAKGMAGMLRDQLAFCNFVEKADESDFDGKNSFKSGDTIRTSIPAIKSVQVDNLDITSMNKDTVEGNKALVLNKTATTADQFDSLELKTDVDIKNALKRYGQPAALALAHQIESRCLGIAQDRTYQSVGTAGANQFSTSDILDAKVALDESLAPMGDRGLFMNSRSGAKAVDARKAFFNPNGAISDQYKDGMIGRADGFDWYESQMLPTHANSSDVTGGAINGTITEGASTISVDGFSVAPTVGSVFTIAGVNKVHAQTKADLGVLQQFTVVSATTTSIVISPAIYAGSDGLQNVTALPADDAALVFVGAASTNYTQNLALHKSAFKMVTAKLYTPVGEELVASETVDGITVNIVRFFDGNTRKVTTRYDVLYGFDEVRPEWSARITS